MSVEFDQRKSYLKRIGVYFIQEFELTGKGTRAVPLFKDVRISLSPDEWFSLCSARGDSYLGECCVTGASIQSLVDGWFSQQSYYQKCLELEHLANLFIAHGDQEWATLSKAQSSKIFEAETLEELSEEVLYRWKSLTPYVKIMAVWFFVQDFVGRDLEPLPNGNPDLNKIDKALYDLKHYAGILSFEDLSSTKRQPSLQIKAGILPALKTLYDEFKDEKPLEGFLIVDTKYGEEIPASDRLGHSFFKSKIEAEKAIRDWQAYEGSFNRRKNAQKRLPDRYKIRPVVISMEKGLSFKV